MNQHRVNDFALTSGAVLPQALTAYRTLGLLNAEGTNAVLVLHGYTTGPDMLEAGASAAEGSWSELVGPGKPIDSDRFFVICPNMLGSCYGSTGPASINPSTGRPYGLSFPRITMVDIVGAQKALLDALGVKRLAAVVGPSFGGYQAFQWGVSHPDFVERIVAAVSAPFHPVAAGNSATTLTQLEGMTGWHGGIYNKAEMLPGLATMRAATLRRYGVDAELASRIPDALARAEAIQRMAQDWAAGFDPGSLLTLMQAAEAFDIRPSLSQLRAPLLMVLSRSDAVFAPALFDQLGPLLDAAHLRWTGFELDSDKGHFASGADAALWADELRNFMET